MNEEIDIPEWTEEWPTEPGRYWFYGHLGPPYTIGDPILRHVNVRKISNGLLYVTSNTTLDKRSRGLWWPIAIEEPEIDNLIYERVQEMCK